MSININKYNNYEAYAVDTNRPADESCVSMVSNGLVFEGKNIILTEKQLGKKQVCLIVKDTVDNSIKYIPVHSFDPNSFDTTRYQLKDWLRYGECMGKELKVYKKNNGSVSLAVPNRYKLTCDTSAAGGFHWAININGSVKAGDVTWDASATLDSIVRQLNAVVGSMASHESGEDFIRITVNSHSNSTLILTDNTGGTLVDLSLYVKIDGVAQEETHRTFQAQSVATLFPSLGYLAANTAQYGKNGWNMRHNAGGNLSRYKAYYRTSAAANGWVAEAFGRMNQATFNKCADGTIGSAEGIALYNKYNGSWDAYMEAGMVQIDDTHTDGNEYQSYDNGADQNAKLVSVTTMDFDGSYVPVYTAAAAADAISDADLGGKAHLPTTHEIALMMEDETYAAIRKGQGFLTGVELLANTNQYWLVAECRSISACTYVGLDGTLKYRDKNGSNSVRPVLA